MSGCRTPIRARARVRLLVALVLSGVASESRAEDEREGGAAEAGTGPPPQLPADVSPGLSLDGEVDPSAAADPGLPWADDHRWVSAGLRRRVASLASLPGGVIVAVTDDGEVQRRDGGRGWRVVLSAPGGLGSADDVEEEDILLDAEAAVLDFSDDADDVLEEDAPEQGSADDTAAAAEDATEDGEVDADADEGGLPQEVLEAGLLDAAERAAREAARRPGVWRITERGLLVSRGDGAWRSADGGQTWVPVPTLPPALAIVPFPGFPTELVAATTQGVYQSGNAGASWFEVESTLSGDRVYDLAADEEYVYAGTDDGLYRSRDGMRWS
ncbi:MAG: hypothetical protein VX000_15935, partial [Myxococcota bacterium]|nr:hypothetical protein [Myxococcota bacterium]